MGRCASALEVWKRQGNEQGGSIGRGILDDSLLELSAYNIVKYSYSIRSCVNGGSELARAF